MNTQARQPERGRWKHRLAALGAAAALSGCGTDQLTHEPSDGEWLTLKTDAEVKYFNLELSDEPVAPTRYLDTSGADVAMAPDGRFVVTWDRAFLVKDMPLDPNTQLPVLPDDGGDNTAKARFQLFDAEARPVGGQRWVQGSDAPVNVWPAASIDRLGSFYIVWAQAHEGGAIGQPAKPMWVNGRRFGADGRPAGAEQTLFRRDDALFGALQTARASDGSLMVFSHYYLDYDRDVNLFQYQIHNADGSLRQGPRRLPRMLDPFTGPALATDGRVAGLRQYEFGIDPWTEKPMKNQALYQLHGPDGQAGPLVTLPKFMMPSWTLFGRDGSFYVAAFQTNLELSWKHSDGVVFRFGPDGRELSRTVVGDVGSGEKQTIWGWTSYGIRLAQGPDGQLVAVWQSDLPESPGLRARYLAEDGSALGPEFRVDEFRPDLVYAKSGRSFRPLVSMGEKGRFAVVYPILRNDERRPRALAGAVVRP